MRRYDSTPEFSNRDNGAVGSASLNPVMLTFGAHARARRRSRVSEYAWRPVYWARCGGSALSYVSRHHRPDVFNEEVMHVQA